VIGSIWHQRPGGSPAAIYSIQGGGLMEGKQMGFKEGEAVGALVRLHDSLKVGRGKIARETTGRARCCGLEERRRPAGRRGKSDRRGPAGSGRRERWRWSGPVR
jgi:hypothetical protein